MLSFSFVMQLNAASVFILSNEALFTFRFASFIQACKILNAFQSSSFRLQFEYQINAMHFNMFSPTNNNLYVIADLLLLMIAMFCTMKSWNSLFVSELFYNVILPSNFCSIQFKSTLHLTYYLSINQSIFPQLSVTISSPVKKNLLTSFSIVSLLIQPISIGNDDTDSCVNVTTKLYICPLLLNQHYDISAIISTYVINTFYYFCH